MSGWRARAGLYVVVALLAWGAIAVMRPIPERRPGAVITGERVPTWNERVDSLRRGETVGGVLSRGGLSQQEATNALQAATALDPKRLPAGMRITLAGPIGGTPSRISFRLAIDRLLHLTKTDSGWVGREERLPWKTDTLVVRGEIARTLYDAFDAGASTLPASARAELAWNVADIFEYRIDMSRDLQPGDEFRVLFERKQGPEGTVRIGRVLATNYSSGAASIEAIRFETGDNRARYYDDGGKSLRSAFLRAPLEFRRISSGFGLRRHPILGIWRAHRGTDYAASSGTPVRSIGDGIVVRAGRMNGYGNVVDVRHANGFVSRYGHLRAFARGVRSGTRVSIGQTIGLVGMTGLATAPHLHFEMLVGGKQRDPRTALASVAGEPLASADRPAFERTRDELLALLQRASTQVADSN
ncbi:MAG: M23 family metallopeptidase [Gemmatimonadota bacterium]